MKSNVGKDQNLASTAFKKKQFQVLCICDQASCFFGDLASSGMAIKW